MKNFWRALLAIVWPVLAGQPLVAQDMARQQADKTISLEVPKNFRRLAEDEAKRRFLSPRAPIAYYADPNGEVDLVVSESKAEFMSKDLPMLKDFYKSNIRSLYTKTVFLKDAIEPVGKRKAAVLEFTGEIVEKNRPALRKYGYIQYVVRKHQVYVFSWTCDEKARLKWQALAQKTMQSVRM